jgi:glycosyltransferase involved in cell wall biosynthesis
MRRILFIVENLPVPFDRRVWNEARALTRAGYEVSVICPATPEHPLRHEVIDGIEIFRHPLPEARRASAYLLEYGCALFWQFVLAFRVLRRRGFDVIHACNPPDLIFIVGFFRLFGKTFVFDHHDLCPELYEAKFGKRDLFWRWLLFCERRTFRTAEMSLATNESYRRIAIERGGMAPERVHVVRSGPSLERMRILPPDPALKRGRRYLVGYVGVMGNQEGIDYLLEAARILVHEQGRDDIQFTLVGSGPELPALRERCSALGLDPFITFAGRLPDEELLAVLNTADVCVNPDEHNEMNDKSTMNKVMEYMALGKAMVQFDLTEGRFSAGEASLYAEPNDARDLAAKLVELLEAPDRRVWMGAFGRERVESDLNWDHEEPKLLAAYETLWPEGAERTAPLGPLQDARSR